ncbi:MAG: hypothetical protein HOP03_10495 [Lysobacter sp.]|nr:hypothetical protein [Lysobacter sp.]
MSHTLRPQRHRRRIGASAFLSGASLFVACAASLPSTALAGDAIRTIPIRNGEVQIERQNHAYVHGEAGRLREHGAIDMVMIVDASGATVSESACSHVSGSYDTYHAFFRTLAQAVKADDVERLSSLVRYPLQVNQGNGKRPLVIANATAFREKYARIFDRKTRTAILEAEPAEVFCKQGSAMIGHGIVWASGQAGRVALSVVNPGAP